ncbi:MAG: hAT transposon family protein [Gammaproteobacteria bacterium]|nr:hAT transposon family protein [Gammaproteobacteria bacterium]
MQAELEKLTTISQIAELLIVKHSSIMTSVPDVATAFKIFLTISVTVSSAERSFSKLKLIKNYLRSTMSQERLSALSILSIEKRAYKKLKSA